MRRVKNGLVAAIMVAAIAGPASAEVYYYRVKPGSVPTNSAPTNPDPDPEGTPDPLLIPSILGQERNVLVESEAVIVGGFDGRLALTVSGGMEAAVSVNGGASWVTSATIAAGEAFKVRQRSGATFSTPVWADVRLGLGESTRWLVATRMQKMTPNPFTIPAEIDVSPSSLVVSKQVLVDGFEGTVNVTASSNSQVSTDGLNWAAFAPISPGQSFRVRMVAPPMFAATWSTGVTVGNSGPVTFNVTTKEPDRPIGNLIFGIVNGVDPERIIRSEALTFYFMDGPHTISASNGGEVSVAGGPWSSSTTIQSGQPFVIRLTASGSFDATARTTVKFGGFEGIFEVNTRPFS